MSGPAPCAVLGVGEAPGNTEMAKGEPFVGAAGKVLAAAMVGAGITQYALANTVCCAPRTTKGKLRAPNPDERKACLGHFLAQVELVDPDWIILFGNVAVQQFRTDLKIGQVRGVPMQWPWGMEKGKKRRWMVPTYHPASVFRQRDNERAIEGDLRELGKWIREGWPQLRETCIICGSGELATYDEMALPWCDIHEHLAYKDSRGVVPVQLETPQGELFQ